MQIYRVEVDDSVHGTLLYWAGSRKEAEAHGRDRIGDPNVITYRVYAQEFPTTKRGMIEWLNDHFTSDNG